jgi:cytidine deaminase
MHSTIIPKHLYLAMHKAHSLASLEKAARAARSRAYAPYSKFHVGAALESMDGKVFSGCNVENISYGLTICAERNAVFAAIAKGVRSFRRIVIVADSSEPVTPCGACRQVLSEFSENMEIVSLNLQKRKFRAKLSELLPRAKAGILDLPCST